MVARRLAAFLGILAVTSLGGCSQTIGLYHETEGGAIAGHRQPPPGGDLPYPNLADVPAAPGTMPQPAAQNVSGAALSGLGPLALPGTPPPLPNISGLSLAGGAPVVPAPRAASVPAPAPVVQPAPPSYPVFKVSAPPVVIAFVPQTALLPPKQRAIVAYVGRISGGKHIRVCGFGDGSLTLALARARRLANALIAAGVPETSIDMEALASGSGGFVQLVY